MSTGPDTESPVASTDGATPDPDAERHVHIVLLGLMGSGKSTVGRMVANELGRPFVDSDSIVELRSGDLPPGLLDREGLDRLHEHELAAFRQVVAQTDSVVYAAAASIVDQVDRDELASVWSVWLDASPSVLTSRVGHDTHDRPLLDEHAGEVLTSQHAERSARGRRLADLTVDTEAGPAGEVAATICRAWRQRIDERRRPASGTVDPGS